jgi:hypothetical protein
MTRKSLWNDFDGIKVAVHPPYPPCFAMEMGFKCGRTEFEYTRRWDYGKVHQVYIIMRYFS